MQIVRLTPDEGPRLRTIRLASLLDAPDAFGSTHAETASRPPESWRRQLETLATFVARIDDLDVGVVRGGPSPECAEEAFLFSMWVAPSARGCGVGEALVAAVVEWARGAGFARVVLDVADDNRPAIGLYARLGFTPTGESGHLPPPRQHIREHRRALTV